MTLSSEAISRLRSRGSILLRPDLAMDDRVGAEEREHRRVKAPLDVRFMVDGGDDVEGMLDEVSATGFSLRTMHDVRVGQRVVAHLRVGVLEPLEGTVVRLLDEGFAVENHHSRAKREKLAASIEWLAGQDIEALRVRRRHERTKSPRNSATTVEVDGTAIDVTVLDASRSGVALSGVSPALGTMVRFGANHPIRGRVVRVWEAAPGDAGEAAGVPVPGCAVEFVRLLPPERVDPPDGY